MIDNTTAEETKTIVRRVWEGFSIRGNLDKADEFFAPGYVNHDPAALEDRHGPEELREFLSMYHAAFPDMQFTIEDLIAEGDMVVIRLTASGTHRGGFMGIPPTGNRATWTEIHVCRIAEGKLVEHWANLDQLGMMQQLGVIFPPEQSEEASPT